MSGEFKFFALDSVLWPFVGNGTKFKIPSEIKPPLRFYKKKIKDHCEEMAWWPQLLWEQFFCLSGPFHLSEFRSPLTEPFMGPSHEYKVRIRDYHFTTHIAYYSFFQAGSSLLHRYTVFIASTTVLLSRFRRKCSLTIISTAKAATSIFSRIKEVLKSVRK